MHHVITKAVAIAAVAMTVAGSGSAVFAQSKQVVWTALPSGSNGYAQAVSVGNAIKQSDGIDMRIIPGKNDVARLVPVREGVAQYTLAGTDYIYSQEGVLNFGAKDWGPQPVRLVVTSIPDSPNTALAVVGNSDIKTVADLKGKRVAWAVGSDGINKAVEAMMAFGGVTWDDVQKVEVSSFPNGLAAVANGQADTAISGTTSAALQQLAASPNGMRYLQMPADDKEGWARVNKVLPWLFPFTVTRGVEIPEGGLQTANNTSPALITLEGKTSDEEVTMLVTAMLENLDVYKDAAPGNEGFEPGRQNYIGAFAPYHTGAIAYLKSKGLWSDEAQARQEHNLKRQDVLMKAWDAFMASTPPSDDAEFKAAWSEARVAALTEAGMEILIK